ncbi:hypothetical protein [Cohnella abietis]|uniref:Uncharacterized protein n=1 Tax=Cohnella abietis TaxID=2507935 RepID=A0A3T1D0Q6_9BACL|nr:hypothetical protein [Cohnella abietis]BBI31692.1 hypothetical protein KCTCHS21_10910 [Cohnella abietis]
MFEKEFENLLKDQIRGASGQRLEMLQRDLTGTRKMLEVLYPVLGTLDGLILEYEMVSFSGVKIYGDVVHLDLRIWFEEENFLTHAELITRDRFTFERSRVRSVTISDYMYFPYSRDELEKKPEFCQRNLHELLARTTNSQYIELLKLPVYEREVLRCALLRDKAFLLADACEWLNVTKETCRKILRTLETKCYISLVGGGPLRCHGFIITPKGASLFHRFSI